MTEGVSNDILRGIQFSQKHRRNVLQSEQFENFFVGQYKSWNLAVLKLTWGLGLLYNWNFEVFFS